MHETSAVTSVSVNVGQFLAYCIGLKSKTGLILPSDSDFLLVAFCVSVLGEVG